MIVPAFTAVPTASAVCAVGAVPVPVDVDADTARIDIDRARDAHHRPHAGRSSRCTSTAGRRTCRPLTDRAAGGRGRRPGARRARRTGRPAPWPTASTRRRTSAASATAARWSPTTPSWPPPSGAVRVHGMTEHYVHVDVSQNFRMSELEAALAAAAAARARRPTTRRRAAIARHYRAAAPHLRWQADHPATCSTCASPGRRSRRGASRSSVGRASRPRCTTRWRSPSSRRTATCAGPLPGSRAWAAGVRIVPCFPELTDDEVEPRSTPQVPLRGRTSGPAE